MMFAQLLWSHKVMYPRWNHECYQIDYGIKMNINNNKLASVMAFDFGVPYTSDIDGEKRNFGKK